MKSIHSEGGGGNSKEFFALFSACDKYIKLNKALFQKFGQTVEKIRFQRVCCCIQCRQEGGGKRQKTGRTELKKEPEMW